MNFQKLLWSFFILMTIFNTFINRHFPHVDMGFPGGSPPANEGDVSSIPGSGRSLREGNGNPPQYSCLGNSIDRGAWQATIHGVTAESDTT